MAASVFRQVQLVFASIISMWSSNLSLGFDVCLQALQVWLPAPNAFCCMPAASHRHVLSASRAIDVCVARDKGPVSCCCCVAH